MGNIVWWTSCWALRDLCTECIGRTCILITPGAIERESDDVCTYIYASVMRVCRATFALFITPAYRCTHGALLQAVAPPLRGRKVGPRHPAGWTFLTACVHTRKIYRIDISLANIWIAAKHNASAIARIVSIASLYADLRDAMKCTGNVRILRHRCCTYDVICNVIVYVGACMHMLCLVRYVIVLLYVIQYISLWKAELCNL